MKKFMVGGAIRDELLGRPVKDVDWVVVGATPQEMIDAGFNEVGADFPVFLHPETKEEFALARQERKVGPGYNGFETKHDPSITLEDDLIRRDLTINAMAREEKTSIVIDPFNGQEDLRNGILRHVSDAFADDPVRVLRVARFAARYGFTVAPETKELMKQLVKSGELDHLTPERVFAEVDKALSEDYPVLFFWTLMECGALEVLFPELGRTLLLSGQSLSRSALRETKTVVRWMLLMVLVETDPAKEMLARLKAPTDIMRLVKKFQIVHRIISGNLITAEQAFDLLIKIDAFRRPDDVRRLSVAANFLSNSSRVSIDEQMDRVLIAFREARTVSFMSLSKEQRDTLTGPAISQALDALRLLKIKEAFNRS